MSSVREAERSTSLGVFDILRSKRLSEQTPLSCNPAYSEAYCDGGRSLGQDLGRLCNCNYMPLAKDDVLPPRKRLSGSAVAASTQTFISDLSSCRYTLQEDTGNP